MYLIFFKRPNRVPVAVACVRSHQNAHTGSGRGDTGVGVVEGNNMGVITDRFNLNLSPKIPYGVHECDVGMLQNGVRMIL